MDKLRGELQDVFRDVFDDEALTLAEELTPEQIEGWDSMMHINLVIAIEKHFGIKLTTAEISGQGGEFSNIGSLLQLIAGKSSQ